MSEDKSFGKKLNRFFDGKGFYIVLSLCVALIGVSAYFLLTGSGDDVENGSLSEKYTQNEEAAPPVIEAPATDDSAGASEAEVSDTPVWNEQQAQDAANAAMVWPLQGEIETPYSMTSLIYNKKMGDWRTSSEVDIKSTVGTQVMACAAGIVEKVYTDDVGGTTVIIEHAGGLKSIYSNLQSVPTVKEGDNVMTGEVIGAVGVTAVGETEENPHLCFSMTLDGQSVDPSEYLPAR